MGSDEGSYMRNMDFVTLGVMFGCICIKIICVTKIRNDQSLRYSTPYMKIVAKNHMSMVVTWGPMGSFLRVS